MKSKRILALVLSLVMFLSIAPFQVLADTSLDEPLNMEMEVPISLEEEGSSPPEGEPDPAPEAAPVAEADEGLLHPASQEEDPPAEEAPAEEAPAEEVPAEEAPAEEAPAEEVPVEEVPAEEVPVEEVPAEEVPAEEIPAEEVPAAEVPAEEVPAEEVPAEEVPAEEVPAEEIPAEEVPAEEAPAEEVPAEEVPAEEVPAEEVPALEASDPAQEEVALPVEEAQEEAASAAPAFRGEGDPLSANIDLDKMEVAYGENITATWSLSGGTEPYQIRVLWLGSYDNFHGNWKISKEFNTSEANSSSTATAPVGTTGRLTLEVEDALGARRNFDSEVFTITGAPQQLAASLSIDKETVAYRESISGSWQITGGEAPYHVTYGWIIKDQNGQTEWMGHGNAYEASGTVSLTVPAGASGYMTFNVRDALGNFIQDQSSEFVITGSPDPIGAQIALNKATVAYQETIQADWTVSGGVPPYEITSWWHIENQDSGSDFEYSHDAPPSGNAILTVPGGETGKFCLSIKDATGAYFFKESETFTITGSPPPMSLTVSTDKTTVGYRETITGSWSVSGGKAPLKIWLMWQTSDSENSGWYSVSQDSNSLEGSVDHLVVSGKLGRFAVSVTDADGMGVYRESETYQITGTPEPLSATVSTDQSSVVYREAVTGSWEITGGAAPYQIKTSVTIEEQNGERQWLTGAGSTLATGTESFTILSGVAGRFNIEVTDADGTNRYFESEKFTITGSPAPIQATVATDKNSYNFEETITGSWTVSGGVQPYSIETFWNFYDARDEHLNRSGMDTSQAEGSDTITAPGVVRGYFEIRVEDADGNTKWFSTPEFAVTGSPEPIVATASVDKTTVGYLETITGSWSASGGSAPYRVQTRWVIKDQNGEEEHLDWRESSELSGSVSYRVPAGASGYLRINVLDRSGLNYGVNSEEFTITGSPTPPRVTTGLDKSTVGYREAITATWAIESEVSPTDVKGIWFVSNQAGHFSQAQVLPNLPLAGSDTLVVPSGRSGFFQVVFRLHEREYRYETSIFEISNSPPLLKVEIDLDKSSVPYQENITATWSVADGAVPYQKVTTSWLIDKPDGNGYTYQEQTHTEHSGSDTLSVPSGTGGDFRITVVDADGMESYHFSSDFIITNSPQPPVAQINLSANTVNFQDVITGSWQITGAQLPKRVHSHWEITDENGNTQSMEYDDVEGSTGSSSFKVPGGVSGRLFLYYSDADGIEAYNAQSEKFVIKGSPPAIQVNINLDKQQVAFLDTVTANFSITGGTAPYQADTYWMLYNQDGSGSSYGDEVFNQATGQTSLRVSGGVKGSLMIIVRDANGGIWRFESQTFDIIGSPPQLKASLILDKTTVQAGQDIKAQWNIVGGTPPYQVKGSWRFLNEQQDQWYFLDIPESAAAQGTHTATVVYGDEGSFILRITDVNGMEAWVPTENFTINGSQAGIQINLELDSNQAVLGQPISASYSISGGQAPYQVQCKWYLQDGTYTWNEVGSGSSDANAGRFSHIPTSLGQGQLYADLIVTDATGTRTGVSKIVSIVENLTPSPTATPLDKAVKLDWAPIAKATKYAVALYENGAYRVLNSNLTATSYTASGLTNGQQYSFLVQAFVNGAWTSDSQDLLVRATPQVLQLQVSLDKQTVAFDESITASWTATGLEANHHLMHVWSLNNSAGENIFLQVVDQDLPLTGEDVLTIPGGVTGEFIVYVLDEGGEIRLSKKVDFTITGSPPDIIGTITLDKTSVATGEPLTANWSVTGGVTPYQVEAVWSIQQEDGEYYEVNEPISQQAAGSFTRSFGNGKTGSIRLYVQDANGVTGPSAFASFTIQGEDAWPPIQGQVSLDKTTTTAGSPITATYSFSGGKAPLTLSYEWYLTDEGDAPAGFEPVRGTLDNLSGTLAFVPPEIAMGYHAVLNITARDASGSERNFDSDFCYIESQTNPAPLATAMDLAVKLEWAPISNATKYAVSVYENGAYRVLNSNLTTTTYTATGLTGGKEYRFLVQAFVNGAWSSDDLVNLVAATPYAPLSVSLAYAHSTGIPAGFPVKANYEVKGGVPPYQITAKYAIMNDGVRKELETIPVPEASGTLTYTPQEQGILLVKLEAKDSRGAQITSKEAGILIMRVPQPVASPQDSAVHLSWEALPYTTKYAVSIYENGSLRVLSSDILGTSYTATGLQNGREYSFLVQAFAGGAWTVDSLDLLVSGTPKSVPVSVPQASATPGDGYVALSWPAVPGASAYAVAIHEAGSYRLLTSTLKTTSFTANNLFNGREYAFLVQANVGGRWSSSDTEHLVYATPVGQPIPTPAPTATAGDGRVDLVWTAIPGASKYAVALREGSGYRLLSANVTGTSYAATGLINGREYQFLVQANVNGRWSANTPDLLVSATPFAKPIPVPLAQSMPLDGAVRLYWGAVQGAGAYAVAIQEGSSLRLLTASITGLSYTVTGLTNGREYRFLVQANVNGRWSSNDAFYLISEKPLAMPIPTPHPQAVGINNGVSLTWEAVPGASKYAVAIREGTGYRLLTADLAATSYAALGLTNGQSYQFLVQAQVNGKWSSNDASLLVSATPLQQAVPVPQALVIPGNGFVVLSWQAIAGASKYAVAIREKGSYRLLSAAVTGTTYTVNALVNETTYEFLVQANVGGAWSSNDVSHLVVGVPQNRPVQVPQAVANARDSAVELTWEAIPGASKYAVAIREGAGYRLLASNITTLSYLATGLKNGTSYRFLVQANVGGRWSSDDVSNLVTASAVAQNTSPVVTGTASFEEISLDWPMVDGAVKYAVSLFENGAYRVLTADWPGTSFTYSNLVNGKPYTFLVQAYANGRWSSDAMEHRITVIPRDL